MTPSRSTTSIVEIETAKSAGRAPRPVRRHGHRRCCVPEGETVAVGTPIIAVDTGVDDGTPPARGSAGRAGAEDEQIEAGKIGGAAPGGRVAVLVGYGPRMTEVQAPAPQGGRPTASGGAAHPGGPAGACPRRTGRAADANAPRRLRHRARVGPGRWPSRRCASTPRTAASTWPTWPARARAASSPGPTSTCTCRGRPARCRPTRQPARRHPSLRSWPGPASGRRGSRSRVCAR